MEKLYKGHDHIGIEKEKIKTRKLSYLLLFSWTWYLKGKGITCDSFIFNAERWQIVMQLKKRCDTQE